jgi:phosphatidate cytidylyltransferase
VRNIGLRLIVWFVGIPFLIAVIFLLPYQNHLAFNILVVASSALGARELASLFERKDAGYRASALVIPLLGMALPVCELLILNGVVSTEAREIVIYGVAALILLLQVARRENEGFRHTLSNSAANIALLLYPGFFIAYLVRLSGLQSASIIILTFLCMVFFNDTMAYLAGMAYRRIRESRARARGREWAPKFVLPVSPSKTLVGFAGGLVLSPVTLVVAGIVFPDTIDAPVGRLIVGGLVVGAATIMGDLIESALKRSATSKDSGSLIPGRGGVLDSIDSVLYAAPAFYYLLRYVL